MSQLLEHILNEDYVSANQIFEEKMLELQEKKMLEAKKMIQAEALGGLTRKEIEDRKKRGYKKAADVLQDPRDIKIKPLVKVKKKKVSEEALDEAGLGWGAQAAHTMTAAQKAEFKAAREKTKPNRMIAKKIVSKFAKSQQAPKTDTPSDSAASTGPGRLQRNWNTLWGREPDHDPSKRDPIKQGGRVGRGVRRGLIAALQAAQPE